MLVLTVCALLVQGYDWSIPEFDSGLLKKMKATEASEEKAATSGVKELEHESKDDKGDLKAMQNVIDFAREVHDKKDPWENMNQAWKGEVAKRHRQEAAKEKQWRDANRVPETSLLEESHPKRAFYNPDKDFADLKKKLQHYEKETENQLAKVEAEEKKPSSFIQTSPSNSFADIDAKLEQLEEKTKAGLAKLNSETAAPSSFIQTRPSNSFADIDAKLKQLEGKTKADSAELNADAAPSSLLEKGHHHHKNFKMNVNPYSAPHDFKDLEHEMQKMKHRATEEVANAEKELKKKKPSSLLEETPVVKTAAKAKSAMETAVAETAAKEKAFKPERSLDEIQKELDQLDEEGQEGAPTLAPDAEDKKMFALAQELKDPTKWKNQPMKSSWHGFQHMFDNVNTKLEKEGQDADSEYEHFAEMHKDGKVNALADFIHKYGDGVKNLDDIAARETKYGDPGIPSSFVEQVPSASLMENIASSGMDARAQMREKKLESQFNSAFEGGFEQQMRRQGMA